MKLFEKIIIAFALTCLFLVIAVPSTVVSYLFVDRFYFGLVISVFASIYLFIMIKIFSKTPKKRLRLVLVGVVIIMITTTVGYELNRFYYKSSAVVTTTEVELLEYHPFAEDTKTVALPEPSSLTLEDPLLKLDGATALYPVYSAFVKATYPEHDFNESIVTCSKTNEAYERLINGRVDMIFAAGPSKQQIEAAKRKGVELTLTPIGREAFVFFVNARNSVDSLTVEQIQDIYSGQVTNWEEVGGRNQAIRAFQRPENSGSQTALEGLMGGKPLMEAPTNDVIGGMGGIISETANYQNHKNAIGYSFRYYSTEMVQNGAIKHLKINDVFPDKETIRSGEYPISAEFYAITAGSENPNIGPFIEWILSEQGQYLIEETGYVSVH